MSEIILSTDTKTIYIDPKLQKSVPEAQLALGEKMNLADIGQYELELIPGISSISSINILNYLKNKTDSKINLLKVKGIGKKKLNLISRYLNLSNVSNQKAE